MAAAAASAAPLTLVEILARMPIRGFNPDSSVADITYQTASGIGVPPDLVGGFVLRIAGEDYHLLKFLGGGTFGKVWAALHRLSNTVRTVKFIKYDNPDPAVESRRLRNAQKEAFIGAILNTKNPTVCSPVYGVGQLQIGVPPSKYFVLCGDRYSETIDDYLDRELGKLGAPARKQLITDVLYGLYRTLKTINIPGRFHFNHGDPKLDNYMISEGSIRMIDMGFAHLEDPGININLMANREYNENNNDTMRDLLQNLLELTIYRAPDIPVRLKSIADTILGLASSLPDPAIPLWHKTYDFVDDINNRAIIVAAADAIIDFLKSNTSTALAAGVSPMTPYYPDESNSHSNIPGMAATASAAAEEDDTRAVIKILAGMPAAPGPLGVAADQTGAEVGFLTALAAGPSKEADARDDAMQAKRPSSPPFPPSGFASSRGPPLAPQSNAFRARNPLLPESGATVGGAGAPASSTPTGYGGGGGASSTPPFSPGAAPSGGGWAAAVGPPSYTGTTPFGGGGGGGGGASSTPRYFGGRRSRSRRGKTQRKSKRSKTRSRKTA
jgi:serine/threonine protein kinase